MASAIRNCLGVDIGTDAIRVAHLEMGKNGPRILQLVEERIELEPDLPESQRAVAVAKQLQDMLKRAGIRTRNAVFSVPGQSVFVRRIKLPRANPEQLRRMVRYEARQQIPFDLDKTIMEFQVFDEGAKEVHVLLLAIKSEFINNFMKLVRRSGLRAIAVSVSSVALYNFHEFNSSSRDVLAKSNGGKSVKPKRAGLLGKRKKGAPAAAVAVEEPGESEPQGFEEIYAFVNIGASLMDLAVPKPGPSRMVGFTRSVPMAGNEMDRAVRDKLGLEGLAQARRVKETQAVVLTSDFEAEEGSDNVNLPASEAVTAVADRIISEIRRSLDFYISQPDGVAVDGLILSGGLTRLRHLPEYVEEKLGLPVMAAEPQHAQLQLGDEMPDAFSPFAVAVGLALQGIGLAQNQIDFLPEDVKSVRSLQANKKEVAAIAAIVLAIIALNFNIGQAQIDLLNSESSRFESQVGQLQDLSNEITKAQERHDAVKASYEELTATQSARDYFFVLMKFIAEVRPPDVLIDEAVIRNDGIVTLRGVAPTDAAVNRLIDGLRTLQIVAEPTIHYLQPVQDPRFRQAMQQYWISFKTLQLSGRFRIIGERPGQLTRMQPGAGRGTRGGGFNR